MAELGSTAHPPAFISDPPRRVLFLCVHNSSRSQMAEGFARALAPPESQIWSAGSQPSQVHPMAVAVMKEVGIDLAAQRSKGLDEVPWREADTVVSVCGESESECPVLPAKVRRVHWPLPDPTQAAPENQLETFRRVRDDIRWRIVSLWPQGS